MKYLIKNGLIVDGTKNKPYKGYIIIEDGIIIQLEHGEYLESGDFIKIIDAEGSVVSPGFIDAHSHSDICYLKDCTRNSKVYQGITTEVVGNCGVSLLRTKLGQDNYTLNIFFESNIGDKINREELEISNIDKKLNEVNYNLPTNISTLVGHGTLRIEVIGLDGREATGKEITKMCEILDRELALGSKGLSLGLSKHPGCFASKNEIEELAKVVSKHDKVLVVHLRDEGKNIIDSIHELFEIATMTGVKVHISHLKVLGNNKTMDEVLDKIERCRSAKMKITADQYPYDTTSTTLSTLLPSWAKNGGKDEIMYRLQRKNKKLDEVIKERIEYVGGEDNIMIAKTNGIFSNLEGKTLGEIADEFDVSDVDAVKWLLIKTGCNVRAFFRSISLKDIINIMKKDYIAIGSDEYAYLIENCKETIHPRAIGTFAKYIEMVNESKLLTLEEMIYKITYLPANIFSLDKRGELKEGNYADVTIFNVDEVKDNSDFRSANTIPDGIKYVIVNGKIIIDKSLDSKIRAGEII